MGKKTEEKGKPKHTKKKKKKKLWICYLWSSLDFIPMLLDLAHGACVPVLLGNSFMKVNVSCCPFLTLGNLAESLQRGSPSSLLGRAYSSSESGSVLRFNP